MASTSQKLGFRRKQEGLVIPIELFVNDWKSCFGQVTRGSDISDVQTEHLVWFTRGIP